MIYLAWSESTSADSYNIYRGTVEGEETLYISGITALNYSDTDVVLNVTYWYKVTAVNGAGESVDFSPEVSVDYSLGAPTNLVVIGIVTGVTPTWTAAHGATSYNLRYSTDNATWTTITGVVSGDLITGLSGGASYYVQVQSTIGVITSDWVVTSPLITYVLRTDAVVYYPMLSGVTSAGGSIFNASSSQYYSAPIVPAAQVGGRSFTAFGFFSTARVFDLQGIIGQFLTADGISWLVYCNGGTLNLAVDDGSGHLTSISGPVLDVNTVYYFEAWQDIIGSSINLEVNRNNSIYTAACSNFAQSSSDPLTIGQWGGAGPSDNFLTGGVGPLGLVLRKLTSQESQAAYNSGQGASFASLPSSLRSSLVFYSDLGIDGYNYNPTDQTGNLTLTNNGYMGPGGGVLSNGTTPTQNGGITEIVDVVNGFNLLTGIQPNYNLQYYSGVPYWEALSDAVHYLQAPLAFLTAGYISQLAFDRTNAFTATAIIRVDETGHNSVIFGQRCNSPTVTGWDLQYESSTGKLLFLLADVSSNVSYIRGSTVLNMHQPYVVSIQFTGSGGNCIAGMSIWVNGIQETSVVVLSDVAGSIVSTAAQLSILADGVNGGNGLAGSVAEFSVNNIALGSTHIGDLHTYLMSVCGANALHDTAPQVIIIGDSIGYGSGVSAQNAALYNLLQDLVPTSYLVRNIAIPGTTAAQWDSNYAATIAPLYNVGRAKNIIVAIIGTNDINNGSNAATAYASLSSIVSKSHGTGFQIILNTVITRAGSPGTNASWTTNWGPLNTLINANSAGADAIANCTGVLYDNTDRAQYNQDMVHPSNAGTVLQAGVEFAALETLGV